jgi:hypothetical protein
MIMAKPFVSIAQMNRCKKMGEEGLLHKDIYDAALAATTDWHKLPERLHPKKEEPKKEDKNEDA